MIIINLLINLVVMLMLSLVVLVLAVAFVASSGLALSGRAGHLARQGRLTHGGSASAGEEGP